MKETIVSIVSFTAFHYPHQHTVDTPVCLPPRRRSQPSSLKSWHYTNFKIVTVKPATHVAILYADRRDRRGVPGAAIAIFAERRDWRIKSPLSGMSDIGD